METVTWGDQCYFVCLPVWIIYLASIRPSNWSDDNNDNNNNKKKK